MQLCRHRQFIGQALLVRAGVWVYAQCVLAFNHCGVDSDRRLVQLAAVSYVVPSGAGAFIMQIGRAFRDIFQIYPDDRCLAIDVVR